MTGVQLDKMAQAINGVGFCQSFWDRFYTVFGSEYNILRWLDEYTTKIGGHYDRVYDTLEDWARKVVIDWHFHRAICKSWQMAEAAFRRSEYRYMKMPQLLAEVVKNCCVLDWKSLLANCLRAEAEEFIDPWLLKTKEHIKLYCTLLSEVNSGCGIPEFKPVDYYVQELQDVSLSVAQAKMKEYVRIWGIPTLFRAIDSAYKRKRKRKR